MFYARSERCFLLAQTRMWHNLPYSVCDTGTLVGLFNLWLLPWVVFFCFPWNRCLWVAKAIYKYFFFLLGPMHLMVLIIILIIIIIITIRLTIFKFDRNSSTCDIQDIVIISQIFNYVPFLFMLRQSNSSIILSLTNIWGIVELTCTPHEAYYLM